MFKDLKPEIKLFFLVVLIAIVISVGGILLLRAMQPPPQAQVLDTSTWQTYRSEEFGFEVRYPDFSAKGFVVTVNAPVQEYEVLPSETLHSQSQELDVDLLRERLNVKVLLNSFQDEQKNHFDLYVAFPGKQEGVKITFEYPRNDSLEVDEIALINQILSTFRFFDE